MAGAEFDRSTLLEAFGELGRLAWGEGKTVEIAVDRGYVRALAARVAEQRGWPVDWLNDGVKGFLSARDAEAGVKVLSGEFPSSATPGLRIFVPSPE